MAEKQRSKYEEKYGNLPRGGQVARMAMKAQGAYVVEPNPESSEARLAMADATERYGTQSRDAERDTIRNGDAVRYDTERVAELERTVSELRVENDALRSEVAALKAEAPIVIERAVLPATDAPRCIHCGAEIVGGTKRAKYCGQRCKSAHHRKESSPAGNSTPPDTEEPSTEQTSAVLLG